MEGSTVDEEGSLASRLQAWGIEEGYRDHAGRWTIPPRATLERILEALGAEGDPPQANVRVVRPDGLDEPAPSASLVLEDGAELGPGEIPPQLPLGYHALVDHERGEETRLIVTPGSCHLPAGLRAWGWAVQVYALKRRSSWGIGDLGALRHLADRSAADGAGMVLVSPLHATGVGLPQATSPYYPGSRSFRNPLYLDMDAVPGASDLPQWADLLADARALNSARAIDHDAVYVLKMRALEACYAAGIDDPGTDRFLSEGGETLELFCTHAGLSERFGPDASSWPSGFRDPHGSEVASFRAAARDRIRFHAWVQSLLDRQLEEASGSLGIVHDLAVGVAPGGADTWIWRDVFVPDVSIGAPADAYNPGGQGWGVAALDPWELRRAAYEPFIQMVRAAFRHAAGMRLDHVMGLFRLFWIPDGAEASEGAYVRYPAEDLLGILALESRRASAYVIGEDLGTVEDVVRQEMAARQMLSYKLLWFEPDPPSAFPYLSLAAATSHDLPTTRGLWTGSDLDFQKVRGLRVDEEVTEGLARRLGELTGCGPEDPPERVTERSCELIARSPSAIATATLEDALDVAERHNFPGTSGEWNWSLALPVPIEDALEDERVARLGSIMGRDRPPPSET